MFYDRLLGTGDLFFCHFFYQIYAIFSFEALHYQGALECDGLTGSFVSLWLERWLVGAYKCA
jgi:hypothetical protein